ncbi:GntR family transcriptional regulator [Cucumibacter marinus]|uniref:GntR family transcriptional regulator n=1 Tax=Cucumibacter marinus TaxID=1121252 RepID=UPI00040D8C3A|nr:GntR family transcriptional regulator [Cucumibacter marinus]
MVQFNETQPIFLQIRQRIIALILNGVVKQDEALPSVRQVAGDLSVNPLTVTKAYQSLVDLGIIEKRRGLGMFVVNGARDKLLEHERDQFLNEEWPRIAERIEALGLSLETLIKKGSSK